LGTKRNCASGTKYGCCQAAQKSRLGNVVCCIQLQQLLLLCIASMDEKEEEENWF
jgi:hypothetical protein